MTEHQIVKPLWRPISEADKTIVDMQEFSDVGIVLRNSAHILARDADGREFEAAWTDHKGGYWWDFDSESPVDPVEFKPFPETTTQGCDMGEMTDKSFHETLRDLVASQKYAEALQLLRSPVSLPSLQEIAEKEARIERLEAALEAIICMHDGNPPLPLADLPEIDYARRTISNIHREARAALSNTEAGR